MRPSYSLDELLPMARPMQLIDGIVEADAERKTLTAFFTVREEWSGNYCAIEYMAQTAAALAGVVDRAENRSNPSRPGFLLGTRKLELSLTEFAAGERYTVEAATEFEDDASAAFSCTIRDSRGTAVATAMLNAYRPDSLAEFLEERR